MKKIIVRVDDVGQCLPNKEPDRDMKKYSLLHEEFRKRSMPYCPCIIPEICDQDMIKWMLDNFHPETVPCLHGWDHVPTSNPDNEFGGIGYVAVLGKILMGLDRLGDLSPRGMSAPYNRYDEKVLRACAETHLDFFLGGYGREKEEVYGHRFIKLLFIPATASLYMRNKSSDTMLRALEELPEQDHSYVLTLHATWQQMETGNTFLSDILDVIGENVVSVLDFVSKWEMK